MYKERKIVKEPFGKWTLLPLVCLHGKSEAAESSSDGPGSSHRGGQSAFLTFDSEHTVAKVFEVDLPVRAGIQGPGQLLHLQETEVRLALVVRPVTASIWSLFCRLLVRSGTGDKTMVIEFFSKEI